MDREEARKDQGLTLDRLLANVGPEAASPGACTGTARYRPSQPCLAATVLSGGSATTVRGERRLRKVQWDWRKGVGRCRTAAGRAWLALLATRGAGWSNGSGREKMDPTATALVLSGKARA
jgi:hypothetical protein